MTATRRLGTIFAADVAGYSRLIGAVEAGALQAFKTMQAELFEPKIAQRSRPAGSHGRSEGVAGVGHFLCACGIQDVSAQPRLFH
jgi:adenylate cyclase